MKILSYLYLTNNKLSGTIPLSLSHLTNLVTLSLDSNQINGTIPLEIGHLTNMETLNLSWNQISDSIPVEIANGSSLGMLSLSHNYLIGTIPFQIRDLYSLLLIDLSYNNLTGNIPPYLVNIKFNLSYNSLKGCILDNFQNYSFYTFIGNKDLCGNIKGAPPCLPSSQTMCQIKIFVPLTIFIVIVLLGYLFHSRNQVLKTQFESRVTKNGNLFSIWTYDGKIAYEDITREIGRAHV